MKDFRFLSSFKYTALAMGHLVALAVIIWSVSLLVAYNAFTFHLYHMPLGYEGSEFWYAGRISMLMRSDKPSCLLVGPSGVRDGFDEETMNGVAPSIDFFNGGIIGRIAILESRIRLLRDYQVKPNCILLGISPFTLNDGMHDIMGRRHCDFLDYWRGWDLIYQEDPEKQDTVFRDAIGNSIWPMKRFAYRINQLSRYGLWQIREKTTWARTMRIQLPPELSQPAGRARRIMARRLDRLAAWFQKRTVMRRRTFEFAFGDLRPTRDHFGPENDEAKPIQARSDSAAAPRQDPSLRGGPGPKRRIPPIDLRHLQRLGKCIKTALEITPHVIVIILPLNNSRPPYQMSKHTVPDILQYLEPYQKDNGVLVLNKIGDLPDEFFRDDAHANAAGRDFLSREIAHQIDTYMKRPFSERRD
jgi:hypothetical protein